MWCGVCVEKMEKWKNSGLINTELAAESRSHFSHQLCGGYQANQIAWLVNSSASCRAVEWCACPAQVAMSNIAAFAIIASAMGRSECGEVCVCVRVSCV